MNLAEKIKLIAGGAIFSLGCIALITALVIEDVIASEVFFVLLLAGIWLVIYSAFFTFSHRPIYHLIYPTMTVVLNAMPPLMAAWLTQDLPEWARGLTVCFGCAIGFTLFALFLYFVSYRPGKKSREFIKEHRDLFAVRPPAEEGYMTEIVNGKRDRAFISVWRNKRHHLTIEKWVSEQPPHYEKVSEAAFSEYHQAYYAAIKEIVELLKAPDNRAVTELKPPASDFQELITKLQNQAALKEKMLVSDDGVVVIDFHKYLSVRLSDDMCEYFHTHWHPSNYEEVAQFLDALINEQVIFFTTGAPAAGNSMMALI